MCFVYALSGRLMLHYIAFPYYDLKIVSECLRTTLRRLKIPGGYAPRSPYKLHLWNVVEGLPGGGLDSRMTVTCIHTNFPYYDLKIVSEYLRNNLRSLIIPKFSGGGGGGGWACPQTPYKMRPQSPADHDSQDLPHTHNPR